MANSRSSVPIVIAIVLLVVPVLYVGSHLALVVPHGHYLVPAGNKNTRIYQGDYRIAGDWLSPRLYWPLEQIDRWVRPRAWEPIWDDPVAPAPLLGSATDALPATPIH